MNRKVRGSEGRSFLLPLLGVLIASVLVAVLVRRVDVGASGSGVAESATVLPFGG